MSIDCSKETKKKTHKEAKMSLIASDTAQVEENGTVAIPINIESKLLSTEQGMYVATYVHIEHTYVFTVCTYYVGVCLQHITKM